MSAPQRYASALIANIGEKTEALLAVQASVSALANAIAMPNVAAALKNPGLTPAERTQFATSCAKAVDAPAALKGLLLVLAANRRLSLLPQVLEEVLQQIAIKQGILPVDVHSAAPLTDAQKIQLKMMLKQSTKARDVSLRETIKPNLMGGFRAFYNGLVWDTSVAGKLTRLKASLKNATQL
jgi:F-type H+-transporting ATPase subunit delta